MASPLRYLHGIEVIEVSDGIRPVQTVKSAVIGLVGTAPDADPELFPINEPILLIGDQRRTTALLGNSGTLLDALRDIYSIIGATIIMVRVEEGATFNETLTNVIGDPVTKTGCWALLTANEKVKVKPRLLCAPGFTGIRPLHGIGSISVNAGGHGYGTTPPKLYFTGGGGAGLDAVTTVVNGSVSAVVIKNPGFGYTQAPTVIAEAAQPVVTFAAGSENTGNGSFTLSSPAYAAGVKPGVYTVTCTAEAEDGGTFSVTDPDEIEIADDVEVGTPYNGVIKFTIADGANDFAEGDTFTVTVTFDPHFVRAFPKAGNVGHGAITLATPAFTSEVQIGDYVLTCTAEALNGGTFEVKDPNGAVLGEATVGTPWTTQIKFTIADGSPDFDIGDTFIVRVTNTGKGFGASFTATPGPTATANPVGKALEAIAIRLRAMAFLDGPNTTDVAAVQYRQDYGSDRVIILDPYPLIWSAEVNDYVARPPSPLACALQARMDNEKGFWYPFSNVVLPMVGGLSRPVSWELDNPDTEANYLNENRITPVVRISTSSAAGFRFWGVRSTASDPLWSFYSVRRTADMIYESVVDAFLWVVDQPISPQLLEDAVRSVQFYLRTLKARGATLGGDAWLDRALNTRDQLAAGHLTISFDIEPPAPIERLTFEAHRNVAYYDILLEEVIRELSL